MISKRDALYASVPPVTDSCLLVAFVGFYWSALISNGLIMMDNGVIEPLALVPSVRIKQSLSLPCIP